jgi:hypothetical protein
VRSRARWLGYLVALVCLAPAPAAFAGKVAKVDLTAYLDGDPQVGDFRVYSRDDGGTLRFDVIQSVELKKSTLFAEEATEDGTVETDVSELVHGKEFRMGTVTTGDITLFLAKPKRIESFRYAPGVPQKFKVGLKVLFQGQRAGKATVAGTSTFVGLEDPNAIPAFNPAFNASAAPLAHFHREETLTIKAGRTVFTAISTSDSWDTLDSGTVREEYFSQSFQDGVPLHTFGPYVYTLDHGQDGGVPYP